MLLKTKEAKIETPDGEKVYILSIIPAIPAREIITQYPLSGLPKLGDYKTNEEIMLKLMSFVAVPLPEGQFLQLDSKTLVDNHVPDWETLAKLEWEMLNYNCSFLRNGNLSGFLDDLLAKLPALISSMLTNLSEQLSQKDEPPSTN